MTPTELNVLRAQIMKDLCAKTDWHKMSMIERSELMSHAAEMSWGIVNLAGITADAPAPAEPDRPWATKLAQEMRDGTAVFVSASASKPAPAKPAKPEPDFETLLRNLVDDLHDCGFAPVYQYEAARRSWHPAVAAVRP